MEIFSSLLALCTGNSPVTKRPATRNFDVFFDLYLNKRFCKQSCGWWFETPSRPLWRHSNEHPISIPHDGLEGFYFISKKTNNQSIVIGCGDRPVLRGVSDKDSPSSLLMGLIGLVVTVTVVVLAVAAVFVIRRRVLRRQPGKMDGKMCLTSWGSESFGVCRYWVIIYP